MTPRQPAAAAVARPTPPRRRRPATHRTLRGTLLEAMFTPTSLIARDAAWTSACDGDPVGYFALPARSEYRRMLLTMRDDMLAGRGASLQAIALAATLARATCVTFARPVPAAAVADTLPVAASLQRDVSARWPNARPPSRRHLLLERLGWACLGPTHCDMVIEVHADALEHRAPYAGRRLAVAATAMCFEAACLHRTHGQDPTAQIEHLGTSLRGLLSLAVCTLNLPPPADEGTTGPLAMPAPVRLAAREDGVAVTLDIMPGSLQATATLRLPGTQTDLKLNEAALRALAAVVLCGDAEEARRARGISLDRARGGGMLIRSGQSAVAISDRAFVGLQNALLHLLRQPPCVRWVNDLELTRGFV